MKRVSCLIVASLLSAALPAAAAPPPNTAPEKIAPSRAAFAAFNRLDRDGKGWLTAQDWAQARPRDVFTMMDRNGEGMITRKEFLGSAGGGDRAAAFARLDRGHKNELSLADLQRGWSPSLFVTLSGGKGYLTAADLVPGLPNTAPPPTVQVAQEAPAAPNGNVCWFPVFNRHDHWLMIFPFSGKCS